MGDAGSRAPDAGYSPTLFLYEHVPGGIGLSERIFAQREALLARAARLIASCDCEGGCPACVGPADFGAAVSRKSVALEMLRGMIDATDDGEARAD
jgi:DEAD/DEAH box helicase domain-containing protein